MTELTLIIIALADEDDPNAIKMGRIPPATRKLEARAELFRQRLNAYTKGLLEPSDRQSQVTPFKTVQYLHRTMRDFVEREDIFGELQQVSNVDFNPKYRLCQAYIMKLKMTLPLESRREKLTVEAVHAMDYAFRADPDCSTCPEVLLDEVEKAASELSAIKMADGESMLTKSGV